MIDCYTSQPHYADHLRPIWQQLPDEVRGNWFAGELPRRAEAIRDVVLVAGYADAKALPRSKRAIYVEHGAGQAYRGDEVSRWNGSYSGGRGLNNVCLFICPNDEVRQRWLNAYPFVPAVTVGCPKLDVLPPWQPANVVTLAWHWDCRLVPETRTALWAYLDVLEVTAERLASVGLDMWLHWHPKLVGAKVRIPSSLQASIEPDAARVLTYSSVVAADNTSLMYEAAAQGIPVVAMNAPWYRRSVNHGLRFWAYVPGPEVDDPDDLADVVIRAARRPLPEWSQARVRAAERAYRWVDGQASARAVRAILAVL